MSFKTIALTTLTVLALVACDKSRSSVTGTLSPANQPKLGANGTIDSGGCNGFEKGCLESYAVDITTLAEYQKVVEPIGEKLLSLDNSSEQAEDFKKQGVTDAFVTLVKAKVWYFVPTSLDQIPSEKLGVAFATEQLALQSKKEIWIDAKKYRALPSDQARGELLFHEVMMAGYLTKFMTMRELATSMGTVIPGFAEATLINDDHYITNYDAANPPPKFTGLQKEDYENIRSMTNYLLNNWSSMTTAEYFSTIKKLSYPSLHQGQINVNASVTRQNIKDAMTLAKKSGQVPSKCMIDAQKTIVPCQVSWEFVASGDSNHPENLHVTIKYKDKTLNEVMREDTGYFMDSFMTDSEQVIFGIDHSFGVDATDISVEFQDNTNYAALPRAPTELRMIGITVASRICVNSNSSNEQCVADDKNPPVFAMLPEGQVSGGDMTEYLNDAKEPEYVPY